MMSRVYGFEPIREDEDPMLAYAGACSRLCATARRIFKVSGFSRVSLT